MSGSPRRVDGDDLAVVDQGPDKLQSALSDVVALLALFADLTEELSKGKECSEAAVRGASADCVSKIKSIRSALRVAVPECATSAAQAFVPKLDAYLETSQATASLETLRLCKRHLEAMASHLP